MREYYREDGEKIETNNTEEDDGIKTKERKKTEKKHILRRKTDEYFYELRKQVFFLQHLTTAEGRNSCPTQLIWQVRVVTYKI